MKLLKLPSPKDLGMSDDDTLELRILTPFCEGPTWEDYEERVRAAHPVRWFLIKTVPSFFLPVRRVLRRLHDFVTFAVIRRFHRLDLRTKDYRYGYLDPCEAMRLACWACLTQYFEKCGPRDPSDFCSPDQLAEPGMVDQKAVHDELRGLYLWWKHGRHEDDEAESEAFSRFSAATDARDQALSERLGDEWTGLRRRNEASAESRLRRLVELRQHLWS